MTATQLAAFVIMAETLPGLIEAELEIQKKLNDRENAIQNQSDGRDYTDEESKELDKISEQCDRSSDNEADLDEIRSRIECLIGEERGNPR